MKNDKLLKSDELFYTLAAELTLASVYGWTQPLKAIVTANSIMLLLEVVNEIIKDGRR